MKLKGKEIKRKEKKGRHENKLERKEKEDKRTNR